jgi:hypothetical protein
MNTFDFGQLKFGSYDFFGKCYSFLISITYLQQPEEPALLQAPYNVFKDMEGPNIVRLFGEWSD